MLYPLLLGLVAGQPSVEVVRDRHSQARDSIHSVHLIANTVRHVSSSKETITTTSEWWQVGNTFYGASSFSVPGAPSKVGQSARLVRNWNRLLSRDGLAKSLISSDDGRRKEFRGTLNDPDELITWASPWSWGLFNLVDKPAITFKDALADPKRVQTLELADSDERGQVKVAFLGPQYIDDNGGTRHLTLTAWFDPSKNYLATKTVETGSGASKIESRVIQFRELNPGVFFPTRAERRAYVGGKLNVTMATDVSSIEINQPIDPSVFSLTFPPGTRVFDRALGTTYVVGNNEQPDPTIPVVPIPKSEMSDIEYPTGAGPPRSQWRWWTVGALALAGLAFTLLFLWFRKSQMAHSR